MSLCKYLFFKVNLLFCLKKKNKIFCRRKSTLENTYLILDYLDLLRGPEGNPGGSDSRRGLIRYLLDTLGAELGGKMEEKAAEQLSSTVEVAVVVLLLVALFLILCWIVCRVIRGVRVCCCAVSHPGDAVTEFFKRTGRYRTSGQVKFDFV